MEDVLQFICSIYPQQKACLSHLRKIIQEKSVVKGELLLRPGQVNRELYFIRRGLIRSYFLQGKNEVVDFFLWEREAIVEVGSFYEQSPSRGFLQMMEDGDLYFITYEDLQYLYRTYIEFNYVGRVLQERYYMMFFKLCRSLKAETALERYRGVLENQPELLHRVPLGDLAKYLKMRPETLSRVRNRLQRI